MNVIISGGACQDLRRIEDQAVRAELVHLAQAELRVPESGSAIEGRLRDYPHMWWRRGVRRANLAEYEGWDTFDNADEFTWQAFNFVLLYRRATSNEMIDHRIATSVETRPSGHRVTHRGDVLMVVRVWDNTVIAGHLDQLL